jgi:hypothetical protein
MSLSGIQRPLRPLSEGSLLVLAVAAVLILALLRTPPETIPTVLDGAIRILLLPFNS